MTKNSLLQKVLVHVQSLDGWQDMELNHSAMHGCNGSLQFFAHLKFDTKNTSFVKIDVDIFDENLDASVVETQQSSILKMLMTLIQHQSLISCKHKSAMHKRKSSSNSQTPFQTSK